MLSEDERKNVTEYLTHLKETDGRKLLWHDLSVRKSLFPERLMNLSLQVTLQNQLNKIPSEDEIEDLTAALEASAYTVDNDNGERVINFKGLMDTLKAVSPNVCSFLQPATFFRAHAQEWPPKIEQRVSIYKVIDFINLRSTFMRFRLGMAWYDTDFTGYLTKEQFIAYYTDQVMPSIKSLTNLEPPFLDCYTHTYTSMFFFFLDSENTGRISILHAIISGLLENAIEVETNFDNWFSPEKTHEFVNAFKLYSEEVEGSLSRTEFHAMHGPKGFIQSFVDRIYEVHVRMNGKSMTYEEHVIFEIAHQYMAHPAALAYFFRILDVDGDGFLTRFEMRFFYRDLCSAYNEYLGDDNAMPRFDDFCDQFFDMVGPNLNGRVSLADIVRCGQGRDFVRCLTSYTAFHEYEMRECEAAGDAADDTLALDLFNDVIINDNDSDNNNNNEVRNSNND